MANADIPPQIAATIVALGVRLSDVVSNLNRLMMGLDRHPDLMAQLQGAPVEVDQEES